LLPEEEEEEEEEFFSSVTRIVLENTALRSTFGTKGEKVTGERRKFHNEELHNLYSSKNIVIPIKSRKMRWLVYVARTVEMRN